MTLQEMIRNCLDANYLVGLRNDKTHKEAAKESAMFTLQIVSVTMQEWSLSFVDNPIEAQPIK